MSARDWYAVLGVGRGASPSQVARAFRRAAFRWHPDRNAGRAELAHRQFLLVHEAYEVLRDPDRRRAYDLASAPPAPTMAGPGPADALRAARPRAQGARSRSLWALLSRLAWLPLALVLRLIGFAALLFFGPIAEKVSGEELDRRVPLFSRVLVPLGRTLLFAGIALIVLSKFWRPIATPYFSVAIVLAGVAVYALERIALAALWAFGKGSRPRGS